jgi:glycosyltransferase involved in cell wall biosynthesis
MKIVYLLLHDFRFASIGLDDFAHRYFHFSKEYARRLAILGHEVTLYVLNGEKPGKEVIEVDGYRLKAFRPSFLFPPLMKFGNAHNIEVKRELEHDAPDIVHFHNYYLWNFPYIAPWVKRRGSPFVAQYHGTDPIRKLKAAAFYPSLRLCDQLLVPTQREERFLSRALRIPRGRVTRLPSTGVDTHVFRRVYPPDPEILLTYVGRVPVPSSYMWEKSPNLLVPMLKALLGLGVRARLLVAGDGPGLPKMKASASRLGLAGSVDFLGVVDQRALPELYSRSRLTFVPMHMDDIEPFWGGTVQESLACGTPVAAFNAASPGPRRFGILVPPGERGAQLLARSLADTESLSKEGGEGSDFVRMNCDWDTLAKRVESMYIRLDRSRRK